MDMSKPPKGPSESVAENLDAILSKDSPLMQRARTTGFQVANRRGVLNSSIAAGAAMGEMIDRATPIAQQEAQQGFQAGESARDRAQRLEEQKRDQDFTTKENTAERTFRGGESALDREQQSRIAAMNLEATEKQTLSNTVAAMESVYASQFNAIMANTDLNAEQRDAQIQSLNNTRLQRVNLTEQIFGVKLKLPRRNRPNNPPAQEPSRPNRPNRPNRPSRPNAPRPTGNRPPAEQGNRR